MAPRALSPVLPAPLVPDRVSASTRTLVWRWGRRVLVLLALTAVGATLRMTYFRADPVPVTAVTVAAGRVEDIVANNKAGAIEAGQRALLSPETGGRIASLPVSEGAHVRQGDVLLRLSDDDLRAQVTLQQRSLDAAKAGAAEACTQADLAERDLARSEQLAAELLIAAQVLDQARSRRIASAASCAGALSRVGQAEAALDVARVAQTKTVLRAPFDGVVTRVSVERGEWLTPAPPGIALPAAIELVDTRSIYTSAPLDEVDLNRVRPGLPVRITMDAYPGRSFPGRVTRVDAYVSTAQQQNRTFDIDVAFDDAAFAQTLPPGTSVDVEVILNARDGVLRIPTSSVLQGGRVLVVRDGMLVSVRIKTGLANWEFTEVLAGLRAGDTVVTSLDRLEVTEGARVRVESEASK